jgi:hypothetical protein
MAIDPNTGVEEIRPEDKQIPGVHPHMKPSARSIRYQPFPKMIYRGEDNKIVENELELNRALEQGWNTSRAKALEAVIAPEVEEDPEEVKEQPEVRRGPGRPRKVE